MGTAQYVQRKHGRLSFRGDQRHVVGEVKGPSLDGRAFEAIAAHYKEAADRTVVMFEERSQASLREHAVADEHGVVWMPDEFRTVRL